MTTQPVTCNLNGGATIVFDVVDTTADDHDETGNLFDMFVRSVGA